jgi:pimeloyl-ACP methyl ester carboxylesterase
MSHRLLSAVFLCHTAFLPHVVSLKAQVVPAGEQTASTRTAAKENWTVLRVDPAQLNPTSDALLGKSETADFIREIYRVQWRTGDPIDLYLVRPKGIARPPVVLYLYSYPADTDRFRDDGWCRRATRGGFAAVGFVSALTGHRYSSRPMKEWFVSELQESLGTTVHDVQMILSYLGPRTDLQTDRVGMFGEGSGGTVALLAAAADPRIRAVDALNPWGDWPDWFKTTPEVTEQERIEFQKPAFLKKLETLDPVVYLPELKNRNIRLQQVMDEPVTPDAAKNKIAAAVVPSETLAQYKNQLAQRDAWRVSGLSGWLHDQLAPHAGTGARALIKP